MSDQGLSIFDDNEPDEDETRTAAADDATQVMPVVPPRPAGKPAAATPPATPTAPVRQAPARQAPARPAPARPAPAPAPVIPPPATQAAAQPAAQAARPSPVAPAVRSPRALSKAATKHTYGDLPVHSFATLLADLATICLNTIAPADPAVPGFRLVTTPTALQRQAFELLGVSHRLGVA